MGQTTIAKLIELAEQLDKHAQPASDILLGRFTSEFTKLCMQYDINWTEEQHALITRVFYWLTVMLTRPEDFTRQQPVVSSPQEHIARTVQGLLALARVSAANPFTPDEEAAARQMAGKLGGATS